MKQNTDQWLNWRRIGSSDAPIIMGVSPYQTPYQLWENKTLGKEVKSTWSMERGKQLEESARQCFEKKMGVFVRPACFDSKTHSFMTASVDGIDLDQKVLVEIKCLGKENHALAKKGKVPEHYMPQLQHQLEVLGLNGMYYFSFDGQDGVIVEVARDDKYVSELVKKEGNFWECLNSMTAPELTTRDYADLDPAAEILVKEWLTLSEAIKSHEKEEKRLREELLKLSEDRNVKGFGLMITKSICKGAVDYDSIPELMGVDREKYRKAPTKRFTFRIQLDVK